MTRQAHEHGVLPSEDQVDPRFHRMGILRLRSSWNIFPTSNHSRVRTSPAVVLRTLACITRAHVLHGSVRHTHRICATRGLGR